MTAAKNRPSLSVGQLLAKAKDASRRGKPKECADLCRQVLTEQVANAQALKLLGLSALQLGDLRTGIEALRRVVAGNPKDAATFTLLGKALTQAGDLAQAEEAFRFACEASPGDVDALFNHAVVLEMAGRFGEASKRYRAVLEKGPKLAEAWLGLGNTQRACGSLDEAGQSFARAVELKPGFASAHHNLGSVLLELGAHVSATAALRKAVDIDPQRLDSWYNLGEALEGSGELEEAAQALEKARKLDPRDAETHNRLGVILRKLSRSSEAVSSFVRALEISPGYLDALDNLADELGAAQRCEEAIETCHRAIMIDSGRASVHIRLGRLLSEAGKFEEAQAAFQMALERSKTGRQRAEAACNLLELPGMRGDPELLAAIDNAEACSAGNEGGGDSGEDVETFRRRLAFARAHGLDRLGRHEEAWDVLAAVNNGLNASCEQDHARSLEHNAMALHAAREWRGQPAVASSDGMPLSLFILGPSRSGKSTLEKLLGELEGVVRGYESTILDEVIVRVSQCTGQTGAVGQDRLTGDLNRQVGDAYARELRARAGGASVFTNTYPGHIYEVGAIVATVPRTRFVFVNRHREDNALRIFMTQYLKNTNVYAYQKGNIVNHLSWHQQMANAWLRKLPGKAMAVSYEDIVAEPKSTLARVAEFCGLPAPVVEPLTPGDDRGCSEPYRWYLKKAWAGAKDSQPPKKPPRHPSGTPAFRKPSM